MLLIFNAILTPRTSTKQMGRGWPLESTYAYVFLAMAYAGAGSPYQANHDDTF